MADRSFNLTSESLKKEKQKTPTIIISKHAKIYLIKFQIHYWNIYF